jgi:molybdopterin-guanine dinucleotide biosynthesis protein A
MAEFDAIVLAGGAARRLDGADKPMQEVGGRPLLARVLDAVAGARTRVVVGPSRPGFEDVVWACEDPPGSGPVAAIAAALPLTSAPVVLGLAADMPRIAGAIRPLLNALGVDPLGSAAFGSSADVENGPQVDAAVLDTRGHLNYLAVAWRREALTSAVGALGDLAGLPVRSLLARRRAIMVEDREGWGLDVDTWDDLDTARQAIDGELHE